MRKLSNIASFIEIIEQGSLQGAAKKLCLSSAAVSKQLKQLEEHLNMQLLIRGHGKFQLTDAGQHYYSLCKEALEKLTEAKQAIDSSREKPTGHLKILCNSSCYEQFIRQKLQKFREKYPEIQLTFYVEESLKDLEEKEIDIIFGVTFDLPEYARLKLGETRTVLCASPEYLKNYAVNSAKDLNTLSFIAHSQVPEPFQFIEENKKLTPKASLSFTHSQSMISAAIDGLGYICTREYLAEEWIKKGELIEILPELNTRKLPIYVYFKRVSYPTPKIHAFLNFFKI